MPQARELTVAVWVAGSARDPGEDPIWPVFSLFSAMKSVAARVRRGYGAAGGPRAEAGRAGMPETPRCGTPGHRLNAAGIPPKIATLNECAGTRPDQGRGAYHRVGQRKPRLTGVSASVCARTY